MKTWKYKVELGPAKTFGVTFIGEITASTLRAMMGRALEEALILYKAKHAQVRVGRVSVTIEKE